MSSDLDPLFIKALRLLHSTAENSADELKALLDECLTQKPSKVDTDLKKMKEPDKLPIKREVLSDPVSNESKKARKISPFSSRSSSPLPVVKTENVSVDGTPQGQSSNSSKADDDTDVEEEEQSETNADEFALELGLVCVICKQMDVGPGNQLLECHDCHSMYHQACHKPQVSNEEANDPRTIWYCTRCTKKSKRPDSSKLSHSSKSGESGMKIKIPAGVMSSHLSKSDVPFKRELSTKGGSHCATPPVTTPSPTSTKPFSGLAATFSRPPVPGGTSQQAKLTLTSAAGGLHKLGASAQQSSSAVAPLDMKLKTNLAKKKPIKKS